jgi:hypothetical protein
LNSQFVTIVGALKAKSTFLVFLGFISISLFLKAGFISVAVIWFFALCFFKYNPRLKKQAADYYTLLFPLLIFIMYAIWLSFSQNLPEAIDIVIRKIHLLLIPLGFIIVNNKTTQKDLNLIFGIFLSGCLLYSLVCLAGALHDILRNGSLAAHIGDEDYYYFSSYQLTEPFSVSPVYLSMYCNFALLITLHSELLTKRLHKSIVAIYLCVFIIMIYSGAGIFCMVAILIFTALASNFKKIGIAAILIGLLILLGGLFKFSYSTNRLLPLFEFQHIDENEKMTSYHTANLLVIWSAAIETIKQDPLIGFGPADGQEALEDTYKRRGMTNELQEALNPHNEFLSTFIDIGFFGCLMLITMLVMGLIEAIKANNKITLGFVIMIAFFLCFESVLVRQKGIVFFSFFYSLLFCHLADKKRSDSSD